MNIQVSFENLVAQDLAPVEDSIMSVGTFALIGHLFRTVLVLLLFVLVAFSAIGQTVEDLRRLNAQHRLPVGKLVELAQSGSADAQSLLGLYYSNGIQVKQDKAVAEQWYLKAAAQGHGEACYNLGQMYRSGALGRPDYAKALRWYQCAAESGVMEAPSAVAGFHSEGLSVPKNELLATMWMIIARERGDPRASYNLDILRTRVGKLEYANAERLARQWLAKHNRDERVD